jgi:hypothetical protein
MKRLLLAAIFALPALPVAAQNGANNVDCSRPGAGPCVHLPVQSAPPALTGAVDWLTQTTAGGMRVQLQDGAGHDVSGATPLPVSLPPGIGLGSVSKRLTSSELMKSTTGATGNSFRVLVYQAAPTLTGVFNTSAYLPLAADITTGAYIGSWDCSSMVANTDDGFYDCAANRPSGNNAFNLTDGTLRFVVLATGAYVSGSGETFTVLADVLASVP